MKIPKQLKIGGHVYKVIFVEDLPDANADIDEKKNVIRIDSEVTKSQQEAAFIHEILGACNPTLHEKDHIALASLAEQLYQVLSDNNLLR